jgi:hypothetical protein
MEWLTRHIDRFIGRIYERELGRYSSVVRAVIESALLSWIATLGSAITWSQNSRCIVRVNHHKNVENCFFVSALNCYSLGRHLISYPG